MVSSALKQLPAPPLENLTSHFILGELVDHLHLLQPEFLHVDIPKLKSHLWAIRDHNVDPVFHLRGFLQVFQETSHFKEAFGELDDGMKAQIKAFVEGADKEVVVAAGNEGKGELPVSPQGKHHFRELIERIEEKVEDVLHLGHHGKGEVNGVSGANGHAKVEGVVAEGYPKIYEDKGETKTMEVHSNTEFENWGQTVKNTPKWTFVPKTILGLSNLVKWAKAHDFRVRCGGYRHSWSDTFCEEKQILVSLLNLYEVTKIPDPLSIKPEYIDPDNELKVIQLAAPEGVTARAGESEKALCRVGVSVTNEQFRRWAVANDKWSLPVDVILVEVTFGGVNGPICHGAGHAHKTVNDHIRAIEYIDANGVHQTISDPVKLAAAAGCFGLLGIVTHITFALDPMSYAIMKPVKPDICLAIPPLSRADIPIALRKAYTDGDFEAARRDFVNRAENDYYSEWFWFTYSQQAWVNTWNTTPIKTSDVKEYPSDFDTWCQWVQGWLGGVITTSPLFNAFPGHWQSTLLSTMGMLNLPPTEFLDFSQDSNKTEVINCALPNALHFRRGIQNMRVRDMEFQIPIPGKVDEHGVEKADWSVVQRAWWDVINLVYSEPDSPMRLTLELRIMGGSDLIMAPQRGNKFGTASIEILSVPDADSDGVWKSFLQKVADLWMGLDYKINGKPLNIRPHWAKEWEGITLRGLPAREYLKEVAYKDAIVEFKAVLAEIGKEQGWGLGDIQRRFGNEMWDWIVYDVGVKRV
ncbi:hypothetical protein B0J14DRAFT_603935 [Halenospora varia]|nr:hypothetical protein B0J14DRAFT_603935 [Halenospora varia]